jgi:cell shape-determining protein MreD
MIPVSLLVLFVIAILNSWAAMIVAIATVFAYRYNTIWLFVVGVLCDAYFGAFNAIPVYSLTLGAFALLVEVLKLRLVGIKS